MRQPPTPAVGAAGAGRARRRRREPVQRLDPVASVVQRLSVLLAAGVAPASSWRYLAEQPDGPAASVVHDVASSRSAVSVAIVSALGRSSRDDAAAWRGLAAAWQVATDAGAPLAPTLHDLAASLRSLAQVQRELDSALAAPVATARLVMVLPVVALLFGVALGFDTLGTLFTTVPGGICLVLGLLLMLMARAWNRRLLARAKPTRLTPGLLLDLTAIAVSGGASVSRSQAAVATAVRETGLDVDDASDRIEEVLGLSRRAGVPAALLLRSEAEEERRVARSEGERRAAVLAVTLMLPLGICVLPAFMLLGVAPLVISVISSTVASF